MFHADLALKNFLHCFHFRCFAIVNMNSQLASLEDFDQWTKDLSSCRLHFCDTQVPARQASSFPSEWYNYQIPP